MAALSNTGSPALLELRSVQVESLTALFEEEAELWNRNLDWDFRPSAELVSRFMRMRALNGYALASGQDVIGYAYYVCEETKGLIGDVYVREQYRCEEYENQLLNACLRSMAEVELTRRVEAQLMLLPSSLEREVPFPASLRIHPRNFMVLPAARIGELPLRDLGPDTHIFNWTHQLQERAARLIAQAYRGHIDAQINDQYLTVAGARRFLLNIVQYPGCGAFQPTGSMVAVRRGGEVCGLSLASLVSPDVGHITQICLHPEERGKGLGYELLRRSLAGLAAVGCRKVSLTVTASNTRAVRLYEEMGFVTARVFGAYVWEGLS